MSIVYNWFPSRSELVRFGRSNIALAQWYYSDLIENPDEGSVLMSYKVPDGYWGFIYGYTFMSTDPSIIKIEYNNKAYYVYVSGSVCEALMHALNEGDVITGNVNVKLHKKIGVSETGYYFVGLYIVLIPYDNIQSERLMKIAEIDMGEYVGEGILSGFCLSNDEFVIFSVNVNGRGKLCLFSTSDLSHIGEFYLSEEGVNSNAFDVQIESNKLYISYYKLIDGYYRSFIQIRSIPDFNIEAEVGPKNYAWALAYIAVTENYVASFGSEYIEGVGYVMRLRCHDKETLEIINEIEKEENVIYRLVPISGDRIILCPEMHQGENCKIYIYSLPDFSVEYEIVATSQTEIVTLATVYENYLIFSTYDFVARKSFIRIYNVSNNEMVKELESTSIASIICNTVNGYLKIIDAIYDENMNVNGCKIRLMSLTSFEIVWESGILDVQPAFSYGNEYIAFVSSDTTKLISYKLKLI